MAGLKVLTLCYEFPPVGGGGGRACWQTARELAHLDVETLVVTARFKDEPRTEERDGVAILRIPAKRSQVEACSLAEMLSYAWSSCRRIRTLAAAFRPDLVHVYFGIPSGPGALWLKRLRGTPYLVSLRGSDVPRPELRRFRFVYPVLKPFLRTLWRRAAAVVAVSDGLRAIALETCPGLDIDVIGNGVDTDRFRPRAAAGANRPLRLLTVGRLLELKGLQYLFPALQALRSDGRLDFDLNVVGDGPYRPQLEQLADGLGIRPATKFLGWVEGDRVPELYREADVLVQPSLTEGMPNTVLEAMASGLAIIATDVPGSRDLVADGQNGALVRRADSESIRVALAKFAADAALVRAMGERSRQAAEARSWARVAFAYRELYEQVIAKADLRRGGGLTKRDAG